jgi:hypothetical protein
LGIRQGRGGGPEAASEKWIRLPALKVVSLRVGRSRREPGQATAGKAWKGFLENQKANSEPTGTRPLLEKILRTMWRLVLFESRVEPNELSVDDIATPGAESSLQTLITVHKNALLPQGFKIISYIFSKLMGLGKFPQSFL